MNTILELFLNCLLVIIIYEIVGYLFNLRKEKKDCSTCKFQGINEHRDDYMCEYCQQDCEDLWQPKETSL